MTNEKALYMARDQYSNDLSMVGMVGKNNSDAKILNGIFGMRPHNDLIMTHPRK